MAIYRRISRSRWPRRWCYVACASLDLADEFPTARASIVIRRTDDVWLPSNSEHTAHTRHSNGTPA